ncbi:hypothetical protein DL93DRAFT_2230251 [Clavulina sp. PMI_390]|nr:hypothetical protein DL93DRAFT_2230251 [Clavulina sp. PMI_390]
MTSAELAPLLAIQQATDSTGHFLAAGTAIYVFDYALTFADEVQYIWSAHFSIVKALFLFNRYWTPIVSIGLFCAASGFVRCGIKLSVSLIPLSVTDGRMSLPFSCQILEITTGVGLVPLFASWNCLIAVRVHAMYDRQRKVKYFLAILLAISTITAVSLSVTNLVHIAIIFDLKVCTPGSKLPKYYWTIWIPSLLAEIIMFGMTVNKAYFKLQRTGLVKVLLMDGLLWFIVLMSMRVANLVMFTLGNSSTVYKPLFLLIGLGSSLISRVILNLRGYTTPSTAFTSHETAHPTDFSGTLPSVRSSHHVNSRPGAARHEPRVLDLGAGRGRHHKKGSSRPPTASSYKRTSIGPSGDGRRAPGTTVHIQRDITVSQDGDDEASDDLHDDFDYFDTVKDGAIPLHKIASQTHEV